ncbi:hypothetical protein B0H17DRAFT_1133415 [Mycena rosella]|uniref:Uncharacterized protein n=1 Tax=Mycena rosella TaxID=1033263 RepID=A0AAD7GIA3_MYCRO|nr:hypothetical protein B0H17DRAFT_1133415 [Mycena rosella]
MALWLDKGMVTKRIRKHPIILRPLFLNGNIRNASGNGGGVLVGYMIIPINLSDSQTTEMRHKALIGFTLRTTETMKQFYEDAMAAPTKTESEQILQTFLVLAQFRPIQR